MSTRVAPVGRVPGLAALALAALLTLAAPALAHAVLLDSDPGDGEVVEGAPEKIVLVFSEPMQAPAAIAVTDPDGEPLGEDDEVEIDGERLRRSLEGLNTDGVYSVEWRVVSADDHPITGELTFEVVDAEPEAGPADEPAPTPEPAGTREPAATPSPADTPTPEVLVTEEAVATGEDGGGLGPLGWLLASAAVVAVVATGAALLVGRRQSEA